MSDMKRFSSQNVANVCPGGSDRTLVQTGSPMPLNEEQAHSAGELYSPTSCKLTFLTPQQWKAEAVTTLPYLAIRLVYTSLNSPQISLIYDIESLISTY